jgi:hypothetical protein
MNTEAKDFKTKFKEYLFNTANHKGEEKNIEEWYLKQTIKFIEDFEKKQDNGDGKPDADTNANAILPVVSGSALECECKPEWLVHKYEPDCFPYGDSVEYDQCNKCDKMHNFKCT